MLNIGAGQVVGNEFLGAGNDTLNLTNDAIVSGNTIDFGSGTATITAANTSKLSATLAFNNQLATMTISDTAQVVADVTGGSNLTVNVNGGSIQAANVNGVTFKTLNVGANGTIKVSIDSVNHINTKFIVDTATFATGSKVAAAVNSLADAAGTYVILSANQITGTPNLSAADTILPFLFKGTVSLSDTGKDLLLNIQRKTTTELGLTSSQASGFNAILAAAPAVPFEAQSLLGSTDQATLQSQLNQLLPDHAGGNFDLLTRGSRLAARHLTDNNSMFDISKLGGWIEAIKWNGSKNETAPPASRPVVSACRWASSAPPASVISASRSTGCRATTRAPATRTAKSSPPPMSSAASGV